MALIRRVRFFRFCRKSNRHISLRLGTIVAQGWYYSCQFWHSARIVATSGCRADQADQYTNRKTIEWTALAIAKSPPSDPLTGTGRPKKVVPECPHTMKTVNVYTSFGCRSSKRWTVISTMKPVYHLGLARLSPKRRNLYHPYVLASRYTMQPRH